VFDFYLFDSKVVQFSRSQQSDGFNFFSIVLCLLSPVFRDTVARTSRTRRVLKADGQGGEENTRRRKQIGKSSRMSTNIHLHHLLFYFPIINFFFRSVFFSFRSWSSFWMQACKYLIARSVWYASSAAGAAVLDVLPFLRCLTCLVFDVFAVLDVLDVWCTWSAWCAWRAWYAWCVWCDVLDVLNASLDLKIEFVP
jgi:hypothetical protein